MSTCSVPHCHRTTEKKQRDCFKICSSILLSSLFPAPAKIVCREGRKGHTQCPQRCPEGLEDAGRAQACEMWLCMMQAIHRQSPWCAKHSHAATLPKRA